MGDIGSYQGSAALEAGSDEPFTIRRAAACLSDVSIGLVPWHEAAWIRR
jgi:hypothetical protein